MSTTEARPVLSGWCSAPAGARPKHEGCRWSLCGCDCHIPVTPESEPFETMTGTASGPQASSPVAPTAGGLRGQADHPAKELIDR
jgi:hypothetical protein